MVDGLPLRYRFERFLSRGENAATLLVVDQGAAGSSAIVKAQKLPPSEAAEAAFLAFSQALREASHPNLGIPYTFGVVSTDDGPYGYWTRPFVHGKSLADFKACNEESFVRVCLQLCSALENLHANSIYHGDVKLENVVVRRPRAGELDDLSQCVLIDLPFRGDSSATPAISEVSLQYMAPELAAGTPIDARSDLFALGVLLYSLATGSAPYRSTSVGELLRLQRTKSFAPLDQKCGYRREVVRLVHRLLEPHPDNRPQSAAEVTQEIRACVDKRLWGGQIGRHSLPFVGCEDELTDAQGRLMSGDLQGQTLIVDGLPGAGVSTFLRELQNSMESAGVVFLAAYPKVRSGQELQAQLFEPVHRLIRQKASRQVPELDAARNRATSSTELLDDLAIAGDHFRVVLCVDDLDHADSSELAFLERYQRQASCRARPGSGCCLVAGRSTPSLSAAATTIALPRLSKDSVLRILESREVTGSAAAAAVQLQEATGGNPGSLAAILSRWTSDRLEDALSIARDQHRNASCSPESELDDAQVRALTGLSLWGSALSAEEWSLLRMRVGADGSADDLHGWTQTHPDGAVRARSMRSPGHLNKGSHRVVVESVAEVVRLRLRSTEPRHLLSVIRFVGRAGFVPARLNWGLHRAFMLLSEHGYFSELQAVVETLQRAGKSPPWMTCFGELCRVEVGHEARAESTDARWAGANDWVRARGLWRKRYVAEALEILDRLLASSDCILDACRTRILEDHAVIAAQCGEFSKARSSRRAILRNARLMGTRPARNVSARVSRRFVSLLRARFWISLSKRRYSVAANMCRKERALHRAMGNRRGEAACYNNEGIALAEAHDVEGSIAAFSECVRLRTKSDDERGLTGALNNLAAALSRYGTPSEAAAALNRASLLAQRNGLDRHRNLIGIQLMLAYVARGQLSEAWTTGHRVLRWARQGDDKAIMWRAALNVAWLSLDLWRVRSTERWLDRLRREAVDTLGAQSIGRLECELAVRSKDWERLNVAAAKFGCTQALTRAGLRAVDKDALSVDDRVHLAYQNRKLKRRALGLDSLRRVLRLVSPLSCARLQFQWVELFVARSDLDEESLDWVMRWLKRPEREYGHDDVRAAINARLSSMLRQLGRKREAWKVAQQCCAQFERLEQKLRAWPRSGAILSPLRESIESAILAETQQAPTTMCPQAAALRSAVLSSLAEENAAPVANVEHELVELFKQGHEQDETRLVADLLAVAARATGAERAVLVIKPDSEPPRVEAQVRQRGSESSDQLSWAVVTRVCETGEPVLYGDALAAEELAGHRSIAMLRLRSLACLPVRGEGSVLGALYFDHGSVAGLFHKEDLRLLELVAGLVALAVTKQRLRSRLESLENEVAASHRHIIRTERNRLAGQLATGLAHDLKNVITAIAARAELLSNKINDDAARKSTRAIEKAAWTGSRMLETLQECTKQHGKLRREVVDLRQVAEEAIQLLSHRFIRGGAEKIRVELRMPDEPLYVLGVAGELREVFLNLVANACDAMVDGGKIEIVVEDTGTVVRVEFSDDGAGIDRETQDRLFEPFFSTKGASGTGIGLAVVQNVVVRHGGNITVESELDRGTTFIIELPSARDRVAENSDAQPQRGCASIEG